MKEFFSNLPKIVSDNGAVPGLPPGSSEAVEKAFESGADAVFLTVRLTSDAVPVVAPEPEITLHSGTELQVHETDSETVTGSDAGYYFPDREGENFPLRGKGISWSTLKDMLFMFPEGRFIIDLADSSDVLTEKVVEMLQDYNSIERILVSSAHSRPLKQIRKKLPRVATTLSSMSIMGAYFLYRSGLLPFKKNFAGDAMLIPEAIGVSYLANRLLIQEMKKRGKAVYIWNVESREEIDRLTDINIDGYITDNIPELIKLLENSHHGEE